jgi:hypothetical protein
VSPAEFGEIGPKRVSLLGVEDLAGPLPQDFVRQRLQGTFGSGEAKQEPVPARQEFQGLRFPSVDRHLAEDLHRVGESFHPKIEGLGGVGPREHLEGQFHQDTPSAQAADEELRQVEAGGVLHHFAAQAQDASGSVDEANAENEIADPAEPEAARAAAAGGDGSAERGSGLGPGGIEGQVLTAFGEDFADLADRCAGQGGEGVLAGLVFDPPGQPSCADRLGVDRGEPRFGAGADGNHTRRGADRLDDFVDGGGAEGGGGVHSREMTPAASRG